METKLTPQEYLHKVLAGPVSESCPVRRTLELFSGKWRAHVLYALCRQERCRFGELKKAIPKITNTMLSATLKDLEALGIVRREQFNEIPPHVEYSLTEKGWDLLPVFIELARWGERYASQD